jgi:hypothetical protein
VMTKPDERERILNRLGISRWHDPRMPTYVRVFGAVIANGLKAAG